MRYCSMHSSGKYIAVKERSLLCRDKEPEDASGNACMSHIPVSVCTWMQADEDEGGGTSGQQVRGQAVPESTAAQGTFTISFNFLWSLTFFTNEKNKFTSKYWHSDIKYWWAEIQQLLQMCPGTHRTGVKSLLPPSVHSQWRLNFLATLQLSKAGHKLEK